MDITVTVDEEYIMTAWMAYMETALWSSLDEEGNPLGAEYVVNDIADSTQDSMLETVRSFLWSAWDSRLDLSAVEPDVVGHDLWLTQNGHGAGFWDQDLGALGETLSNMARQCGPMDLFVDDDGEVCGL